MSRRDEHIEEVKDRIVYAFLKSHFLHEAEAWGFAPYDFKIVHDYLVRKGFEPLPHLSDTAYKEMVSERAKKALSKATGLPPERIHNDRHHLDMD